MVATMKKKRIKPRQPRNWLAVHAHNKTSAGPMKDKKKKKLERDIFEELMEGLDEIKRRRESEE